MDTFVFIIWLLCELQKQKNTNHWENVKIDGLISKDSIYRQLDKQEEIFSMFDNQDSLMKKTSDVAYFRGKKIDTSDNKYSKFNNCRAYFFHPDTLSINIGIGDGFTSHGFIIDYINNKFYTEAYHSTDVIIEGQIEPTHKIIYQKLTLDKPQYQLGDSLYGKIEFKSIETSGEGMITEHFGKGNFRTKVGKR